MRAILKRQSLTLLAASLALCTGILALASPAAATPTPTPKPQASQPT